MLLRHHLAGRVRDMLHALFRHGVAAAAGDQLAVFLRHHLAGRVAHLARDGVGHELAGGVILHAALLARHHAAGADHPAFFTRHPDTLAHPLTWALHRVIDHGAWAVTRGAGAGIEGPAARQPATPRHDGAGAVVPLDLPGTRADL